MTLAASRKYLQIESRSEYRSGSQIVIIIAFWYKMMFHIYPASAMAWYFAVEGRTLAT